MTIKQEEHDVVYTVDTRYQEMCNHIGLTKGSILSTVL